MRSELRRRGVRARQLRGRQHYEIDEKQRAVTLTEEGIHRVEKLIGIEPGESLYDERYYELTHYLENALKAEVIFKRDRDYMVRNGEVVIIDEFTGRMMPGRRWSDGLHQAIEAKERVPIQNENQTLASITFQNLFRLYTKLAGMTGTADTEAYEFQQIYNLEVVVIPTNRPMIRNDMPDLIYLTPQDKYAAVIEDIRACRERGQPDRRPPRRTDRPEEPAVPGGRVSGHRDLTGGVDAHPFRSQQVLHPSDLAALGGDDARRQPADLVNPSPLEHRVGHGDGGAVVRDHRLQERDVGFRRRPGGEGAHLRRGCHARHQPCRRMAHPCHRRRSPRHGQAPHVQPPPHLADLGLLGQRDVGRERPHRGVLGSEPGQLGHLDGLRVVDQHVAGEPGLR